MSALLHRRIELLLSTHARPEPDGSLSVLPAALELICATLVEGVAADAVKAQVLIYTVTSPVSSIV
jgi:hypothetical protein